MTGGCVLMWELCADSEAATFELHDNCFQAMWLY